MKVLINGQDHEVDDGEILSYEKVVTLAGYDPKSVITVTYSKLDASGHLTFGQSISAREGLRLSAMYTGNA